MLARSLSTTQRTPECRSGQCPAPHWRLGPHVRRDPGWTQRRAAKGSRGSLWQLAARRVTAHPVSTPTTPSRRDRRQPEANDEDTGRPTGSVSKIPSNELGATAANSTDRTARQAGEQPAQRTGADSADGCQAPLNPQVLGSNPRGRTTSEQGRYTLGWPNHKGVIQEISPMQVMDAVVDARRSGAFALLGPNGSRLGGRKSTDSRSAGPQRRRQSTAGDVVDVGAFSPKTDQRDIPSPQRTPPASATRGP